MKRLLVAGVAVMLAFWGSAASPLGGLAVAVSPDGKKLMSAGDNRTLYTIDAATMEVTARHWLGDGILALSFTSDGSRLVAESTDEALLLIDANSGAVIKKEDKAGRMSTALTADLVAGLNPHYNGHIVRLFAMSDLTPKTSISFVKGDKVAAMGLSPDGKRLAVWLDPVSDDTEPVNRTVPADKKGLEADEFKQKNDGKTSRVLLFNTADGSKIADYKTFYSPSSSGATIFFQGENVLIVTYSNLNLKVDAKGECTLFKLEGSFNYGLGASADQQVLMGGGLAAGVYVKTVGMEQTKFQVGDRLPGWPEYFKSFAVDASGIGYGATSGYRIIRVRPDGTFDKSFPVF